MLPETRALLQSHFGIAPRLVELGEASEQATEKRRRSFRRIAELNQLKVLQAFQKNNVSESHFAGTSGYGFHDSGRAALDRICADIFHTESGLIRWQFVSGTHALSSILFGNLRPGDNFLSITGPPYDTLQPVINGKERWQGSLAEWGIGYGEIALTEKNAIDSKAMERVLRGKKKPRLVYMQRSVGYSARPSISLQMMKKAINSIKSIDSRILIMVDNCYGEFVDIIEPTDFGADILGGSLIKNPGGGIIPTGAYIVGRKDPLEKAAIHLTSPGIGPDEGATMGILRTLFQGLFMAPSIVCHAVEGAIWAAHLLESLGMKVIPTWRERRTDTIQGIILGGIPHLRAFCRGIQKCSPVDSMAIPEAVSMPGYRDPILMAGGTFIQGSSIELSADGPLREPYAVYLQGGLSYHHVKAGVMSALNEMLKDGLLKL